MIGSPASVSGKFMLENSSKVSKVNRQRGVIKGVHVGTSWKEEKFGDNSSGLDVAMDELWESYTGRLKGSVSSPKI